MHNSDVSEISLYSGTLKCRDLPGPQGRVLIKILTQQLLSGFYPEFVALERKLTGEGGGVVGLQKLRIVVNFGL